MVMNDRKRLFVKEYLIDFNATQAALRAGYSPKTAYSKGHQLLNDIEIRERLEKAKKRREDKLDITAEGIIQAIANEAKEAQHPRDRLRALELLAKHLGILSDRLKVDVAGRLELAGRIAGLNDEELAQLAGLHKGKKGKKKTPGE